MTKKINVKLTRRELIAIECLLRNDELDNILFASIAEAFNGAIGDGRRHIEPFTIKEAVELADRLADAEDAQTKNIRD